ncbi:MAG: hypothetical protein EON88_23075, partial [Brevundimonas sp.]
MFKLGPNFISGWIDRPASEAPSAVSLYLNGVQISETYAARDHAVDGGVRPIGFSFGVKKLWPMLGAGDVLEVRQGDQSIDIEGHGARLVLHEPATSRSAEVLKRLRKGGVLDRAGGVRTPLADSPQWVDNVFDLYETLGEIVQRVTGASLELAYGTLLGCVREGDFIRHDDDFDSLYISRHSTPEAVTEEFARLFQAITDAGLLVRFGAHGANVMVVSRPDSRASIDIFYGWFNDAGELGLSYGWHGRPVHRSETLGEPAVATLAGRSVAIPAFAESLLEQKYGAGWRVPDHGFAHKSDTRRTDKRFYLDKHRAQNLYWNAFYARNTLTEASTFARLVVDSLPMDGLVIDIGCGTGKDTNFFAGQGREAIGADASAQGVANAAALGAELKLER